MLNVLWVEDEFSEQKQISWFRNRKIIVKTNFLDAYSGPQNPDSSLRWCLL